MMSPITEAAQYLLNCDISVIPVNNSKKCPIEWKTFQSKPLEFDQAPRVFDNSWGIAIVGGTVSDGVEFIDFDSHNNEIDAIFQKFISDTRVSIIIKKYNPYIEKTMNGGYHLAYLYDCTGKRDGNKTLSRWENKESMIETRAEGGYCIVYPTPGYVTMSGDLGSLPRITEDERNYLIEFAKSFNRFEGNANENEKTTDTIKGFDNTDPISWFNWNKDNYAKNILKEAGWKIIKTDDKTGIEYWQRPGKDDDSHSATWGKKHNSLFVFSSSTGVFEQECYYTPFQILVRIRFKGDYRLALTWIIEKYGQHTPFTNTSGATILPQDPTTDPIAFYNTDEKCLYHCKRALEDIGWIPVQDTQPQVWRSPSSEEDEVCATFDTMFNVSVGVSPFNSGFSYTPYQVLTLTVFKGNFRAATEWILTKYFASEVPYMRIGIDYFKLINKKDRFGIVQHELKRWSKDEIKQDHDKHIIPRIPLFDDFTIAPNNINYEPVVGNCYNLYREFPHRPSPGSWHWTEVLLRHIFGEQYDLGIRYLQALYLNPEHLMPILVLVSRERQTGKTTFINWLGMVFGDNMANIAPEDLTNGFNSTYAASNIVAVEETLIEKNLTVEKIKALATTKFITVNQKFVSQYRMPFFGKIILTSNNEDKFARIDQEEIRFFIRKVPIPTTANHNIENDMIKEIPAFLNYLTTLPPIDWSRDRTGFTPEELDNASLKAVKDESKTEVSRDLRMLIEDLFLNDLVNYDEFHADAKTIKDKYFHKDPRNGYDWLHKIIKRDFGLNASEKSIYFKPFINDTGKTGRPFTFKRSDFVISEPEQTPPPEPDPF